MADEKPNVGNVIVLKSGMLDISPDEAFKSNVVNVSYQGCRSVCY